MSIMRSRPLYLLLAVVAAACGTLAGADDTSSPAGPDGGEDGTSAPPPGDDGGDEGIELEAGADVVTTAAHRYAFVSAGVAFGNVTTTGFNALCTADATKVSAWTGRKFIAFLAGARLTTGPSWYLPGDTDLVFDGTNPPSTTSLNMLPKVAINVDATGHVFQVPQLLVWTGSKGADCVGWTTKSGTNTDVADANDRLHWLYLNSASLCGVQHHVYCFED
jgi:hypothetical protein